MKIYKQNIIIGDNQLQLPINSKILCVQTQFDEICVWYEFDQHNECTTEIRFISIFGTGHIIPDNMQYISTIQLFNGTFIGHVYVIRC